MPDLDVRITSMYPPGVQGGIRAYASATIAGCFAVRGIKIVEGGKDGLFMSMEKRDTDLQGELNDTVQKLYEKYVPQATREYIDDKVAREISTRERTRRADRTARREESQLEESEIV